MRSPKQRIAQDRNWKIHQLRMMYGQAIHLTAHRHDILRLLIEEELHSMGAKTMAEQREEFRKELGL